MRRAILLLFLVSIVLADCGCSNSLCCSKWGYCGTGALYCDPAQGCKQNCWGNNPTSSPTPTTKSPAHNTSSAPPPTFTRAPNTNKFQLAAYWGQDTVGLHFPNNLQKNLDHYCQDNTYDVLIVSFLITFFGSQTVNGVRLPEINLANSCTKSFAKYPTLLECPDVGAAITTCQKRGKKVILSLGGAAGSYGFTSADQPAKFGATLWDMFLGGNGSLPRPFGNAVFDGIDLDIEGGGSQYYDDFVRLMKEKYFNKANRKYYITGAPQCPFPDAYLSKALDTGHFDYVFVQFYNNYCGVNNWQSSSFNWGTWEAWAKSKPNTKIFLGVPADTYAGNGYVDSNTLRQVLNKIKNSPVFGGVMLWDATVSMVNGFGAAVANLIH